MKECWRILKKLGKRHRPITLLILFALLIIGFVWLINTCPYFYQWMKANSPNAISRNISSQEEITAWLSLVSSIAAMVVAIVAWFKAGDFYRQNETNLLLHIDERWGSPESIKARIVIHNLYIQVRERSKAAKNECNKSKDYFIQKEVACEIIKLSESKTHKEGKDFIHILNFLDFMETIGYLEDKDRVSAQELNALCGESILFNYSILEPYIVHKRCKHSSSEFYVNFERLAKKIREKS